MRPSTRRRRLGSALAVLSILVALVGGLSAGAAVLHPRTDSPGRVDAVVVVAGAIDDRYEHALTLAVQRDAEAILVSRPVQLSSAFVKLIDPYCAMGDAGAEHGRRVPIECFTPDVDTTEGEAAAATRIARERGWGSLLVVTYWGHVSRVRIYFEQCFGGNVYVTDTPRPAQVSRRYALLHETGGYVKALLRPAC